MNIVVIGGGRWARALCAALAPQRGQHLALYRRGGPRAGDGPTYETSDLSVLAAADLLVLAVPAAAVRPLLREAGAVLHGGQMLVHAVGSLEPESLVPISRVVLEETPLRRIGALAGPALSQDLEEGRPAALICGSRFDEVGEASVATLSSPGLRLYTTRDLLGVELARALVAAVALAGGVAHALSLGAAARAILVTRGAAEMARLGVALGAQERIFFGLAGIGELLVATEGWGSADHELGRLLGKGMTLTEAQQHVGRTTDGPTMVAKGLDLARQHGVRMPLLTAMDRWLRGERSMREALSDLFASSTHVE